MRNGEREKLYLDDVEREKMTNDLNKFTSLT